MDGRINDALLDDKTNGLYNDASNSKIKHFRLYVLTTFILNFVRLAARLEAIAIRLEAIATVEATLNEFPLRCPRLCGSITLRPHRDPA